MENLRTAIEKDLYDSIEGEWKLPVELTGPDGITQTYSKNNPTELLGGQILYFTKEENPETGEVIIVNNPVVSLRISSLDSVPEDGETWHVKMPISPIEGAEKFNFVFTATRSKVTGTDLGFMKIYLQRLEEPEYDDV